LCIDMVIVSRSWSSWWVRNVSLYVQQTCVALVFLLDGIAG